jgi:type II secretory pathway predicted ATPase ExeA
LGRFFNTEGPVDAEIHYAIPPLGRVDLPHIEELIDRRKYFLVHAPRQTGKTSCLQALVRRLNGAGRYRAVYANVEGAQTLREKADQAIPVVLAKIADGAVDDLDDYSVRTALMVDLKGFPAEALLETALSDWSRRDPRPIVLVIDEADSLVGDTLLSMLRQLRSGYAKRPRRFPQSVILCGVRDIRDYRLVASSDKDNLAEGSAFNIRAESLRLGDFSRGEVESLYGQHTAETGQAFEPAAVDRVWYLTQGQPWLVNALAYEAVSKSDGSGPITASAIDRAKEALILARVTHIDQLGYKLRQERVRRVVEPIIVGGEAELALDDDDIQYCIDLGLVARRDRGLEIANPIYREVIPRSLTFSTEVGIESSQDRAWYILADGTLDMEKLLAAFQQFFRQHAEHWRERFQYKEAGPQLLLQAFLQRVVNGGGRVEREYGLGRMRTDLLVVWPHASGEQRVVIEIKASDHPPGESALRLALAQTAEYMDRCGTASGHLVWFDRGARSWEEKIHHRVHQHQARSIQFWGC